jgi:hypothetical protein
MSNQPNQPNVVRIDSYGFESEVPGKGSRFPLFGIFLIVLGLLLAAGQVFPQAQVGASAFFLAVGAIVFLMGVRDHSDLALYCGAFVAALALSDLLAGAGVLHGPGWGTLFIGLAVAGIGLFRARRRHKVGPAVVIGALLAVWGGTQVAFSSLNFSLDKLIGPLLIVALGLFLITRSRPRSKQL